MHRGANLKLGVMLISIPKAHKLLKRGCEGYLCNVVDLAVTELSIDNILIVYEYPAVLPKEIPRLPPGKLISVLT